MVVPDVFITSIFLLWYLYIWGYSRWVHTSAVSISLIDAPAGTFTTFAWWWWWWWWWRVCVGGGVQSGQRDRVDRPKPISEGSGEGSAVEVIILWRMPHHAPVPRPWCCMITRFVRACAVGGRPLLQSCTGRWYSAPAQTDFFALLKCDPRFDLNEKELTRALWQLQKEYHPDKLVGKSEEAAAEAEEMSTRINTAYQTLRNPHTRSAVGRGGRGRVQQWDW